jgi:ELWxxDGT repeat protein
MPAKYPRLAVALALALSLVVAAPASALQPPDLHTVDLVPGSDGSYAAHFTRMGAWDYFYAYESGHQGLWRTNGATTELVTDQVEVASDNSYYRHPDQTFAVLGTYLYFAGSTAAEGQELWRTDGVNTELVKNIAPGTANGVSPVFKKLGAYVYFSGGTTATGLELWRTNGSSTSLVKEIEPGTADSNPYGFFEFNGKLYFSAFTTLHGVELWRTDGTSAGTVEFDLAPGAANSLPGDFTIFQNRMFFLAGSDYFHLWYATGDSVSEFPYTPNDVHDLTAKQIAQMLWYYLDGLNAIRYEAALEDNGNFNLFHTYFSELDTLFMQSKKTNRWWMQMPDKKFIPCSYKDYMSASMNDIPERWLRAQERTL